jgi:hypothetical protein
MDSLGFVLGLRKERSGFDILNKLQPKGRSSRPGTGKGKRGSQRENGRSTDQATMLRMKVEELKREGREIVSRRAQFSIVLNWLPPYVRAHTPAHHT